MISTSIHARSQQCDDPDWTRLLGVIGRHRRVLVAFSGGVDSALVAAAAAARLGDDAVAVTGRSASLAADDLDAARCLAAEMGIAFRPLDTHELDDPSYRANAGDRCYFCKSELYGRLEGLRAAEGFDVVLDGTNTDDFGDTRPGLRAAREQRVVSPLVEAGLDKASVRKLARAIELPVWNKPANACLASRLPVGTAVSFERLKRVELAEQAIRGLGFEVVRVRVDGERGRVEVGVAELERATRDPGRSAICEAVRAAGFAEAWVDPAGYRLGGADRAGSP